MGLLMNGGLNHEVRSKIDGACPGTAVSGHTRSTTRKHVATQIEFGAIVTTGNNEDENIKYKVEVAWDRGNCDYIFSSDGFRSAKDDVLAAQRAYHVGRAEYTVKENSFIQTRLAYEDDRFSGFDSQSDLTINYRRKLLLNRSNMDLSLNFGAGVRRSVTELDTSNEAIARIEGNYLWNLSETADFIQIISIEPGSDSTIFRTESAIETTIVENLALKFSIKGKHQTEVPLLREKTDTETAITLVWNF